MVREDVTDIFLAFFFVYRANIVVFDFAVHVDCYLVVNQLVIHVSVDEFKIG